MTKNVIFAGFMGMLFVTAANAANGIANDPTTYPAFSGSSENPSTNVYVRDPNVIKVATKKHVEARVATASGTVVTLDTNAGAEQDTIDTNADEISDMQTDRQVTTTNAATLCANLASNNHYSGCGYISNNGTGNNSSSDYKWVLIASEYATPSDNGQ